MARIVYVMCPCCGRSIPEVKLHDAKLEAKASEAPFAWELHVEGGRGQGKGFDINETKKVAVPKSALGVLVARAKAFLKAL